MSCIVVIYCDIQLKIWQPNFLETIIDPSRTEHMTLYMTLVYIKTSPAVQLLQDCLQQFFLHELFWPWKFWKEAECECEGLANLPVKQMWVCGSTRWYLIFVVIASRIAAKNHHKMPLHLIVLCIYKLPSNIEKRYRKFKPSYELHTYVWNSYDEKLQRMKKMETLDQS